MSAEEEGTAAEGRERAGAVAVADAPEKTNAAAGDGVVFLFTFVDAMRTVCKDTNLTSREKETSFR